MLHRPHRPLDHFSGRHVRDAEQHEGPQIDAVESQKIGRAVESKELQSLVELLDGDRMNRFETHGDFEPAGKQRSKFERHRADRTRVRFHGDRGERARQLRQAWKILLRHRPPIEEVARVVKLQSRGKRRLDLL